MGRRTSEPETIHPVDGASGLGRVTPPKVSRVAGNTPGWHRRGFPADNHAGIMSPPVELQARASSHHSVTLPAAPLVTMKRDPHGWMTVYYRKTQDHNNRVAIQRSLVNFCPKTPDCSDRPRAGHDSLSAFDGTEGHKPTHCGGGSTTKCFGSGCRGTGSESSRATDRTASRQQASFRLPLILDPMHLQILIYMKW